MLHPSWLPARLAYLLVAIAAAISLTACTKANPLDCSDGTCTDPAHPFCDVDGSLGDGTPLACIAVTCTPGDFQACRGAGALTCNAAGTDYDLTQCADGCDATAGCRLCAANQTVCANGMIQTCDASGAITASHTCPLGCFQDEPRCRDLAPSNDLASYLDMAASAPDLVLGDGDVIYTDTHQLSHGGAAPVALPVPAFLIDAPPGGAAIRVLVANHVQITGHVWVRLHHGETIGPALAIVASNDIRISGALDFTNPFSDSLLQQVPGGVTLAGCTGGLANDHRFSNVGDLYPGSGGGGHATAGAHGGKINGSDYLCPVSAARQQAPAPWCRCGEAAPVVAISVSTTSASRSSHRSMPGAAGPSSFRAGRPSTSMTTAP